MSINMSDLGYYGFDLLKDEPAIDHILNQKPESIRDMTDLLFEYSRMDGTLTHSTAQAATEFFNEYSVGDIVEEFQGLSRDVLNTISIERAHVYFAERDFTDMLYKEYENREYPQDMTDSERMLAILFDVSVENDLGLEKEYPEIALAGLHAHTPEHFMEVTGFTSVENLPDHFKNYEEFIDCINSENKQEQSRPAVQLNKPTGKGLER